jgi:hypothetical protein
MAADANPEFEVATTARHAGPSGKDLCGAASSTLKHRWPI